MKFRVKFNLYRYLIHNRISYINYKKGISIISQYFNNGIYVYKDENKLQYFNDLTSNCNRWTIQIKIKLTYKEI